MVGIIILNYNSWKDTIKCVESIKCYTKEEYHIYIIDNCSTDTSAIKLGKYILKDPKTTLTIASSNGGFSKGNNIGIKQALLDNVEYIILLNSDVVLLNDAIGIIKNVLDNNSDIAIAGPSILLPDKSEGQLIKHKLTLKEYVKKKAAFFKCKARRENSVMIKSDQKKDFMSFDGMISGCFLMLNRNVIDKIGLLDENVFLFYEEDILAYKLDLIKKKAAIVLQAKILHNHHNSIKREGNAFARFYLWTSPVYVLKQYGHVNKIILFLIINFNIFLWILLSIRSKEYYKYLIPYVKENYKILFKE